MAKFVFESQVCSRCGGSGHYSYCQMYGTTCFKCAGKKEVLTARGAAAQTYFTAICSKKAGEIKVGDKIYNQGFAAGSYVQPSAWCTVTEVRPGEVGRDGGSVQPDGTVIPAAVVIETDKGSFHGGEGTVYRVAQGKEEKAAKVAQALAYQATLTVKGVVRKAAPQGAKTHAVKAATVVFNVANPAETCEVPAGTVVKYVKEVVGGEVGGKAYHVAYVKVGGVLYAAVKPEEAKKAVEAVAAV
jgi:hypothetical protein